MDENLSIIEKLKAYKYYYGELLKCRKCIGFYRIGFVCVCGEDNSKSK